MFNLVRKIDGKFLKDILEDTNKKFAYLVAIALNSNRDSERLWQMKDERMHTIIIKFGRGLAVFKFYRCDKSIERAILNNADVELIAAEFDALDGESK